MLGLIACHSLNHQIRPLQSESRLVQHWHWLAGASMRSWKLVCALVCSDTTRTYVTHMHRLLDLQGQMDNYDIRMEAHFYADLCLFHNAEKCLWATKRPAALAQGPRLVSTK